MARLIIYIISGAAVVYVAATGVSALPLPDINPDSKLYFVDNLIERLKLLSSQNPDEKIGQLLEYSDEKLEEMKSVINGESEEKGKLLEKVLPVHEKYIMEALEQVQKIKEEERKKNEESATSSPKETTVVASSGLSGSTSVIESEISNRVLEKKELLNEALSQIPNESNEEKEMIREEIIKTEKVIEKIIEQVEGPVKEVIIYKTERTDEAIEDKQEEEQVQQQEEEKDALTSAEKLYDIWIDSLYPKILPNENEPFFMRAHVRRRDDECKFFSGKVILKIAGEEWEYEISRMQPSDDAWFDLGPIELSAGAYPVEGKLIDKYNQLISTKNFEMMVE